MSFIKLQFKPGMNRDQTNYSNEGCWYACDKIRFRSGYPEKIGGWVKYNSASILGACRQMWAWSSTESDKLMALGTNSKLYLEFAGGYFNITPLRATTPTLSSPNTNNSVSVSYGLNVVTITLPVAHAAATGDYVQVAGIVGPIGGIPQAELNGNFSITVTSDYAFTYTTTTSATASVAASGGTAIVLSFEISPGYAIATDAYGWGTGTWGRTTWGSPSTTPITLQQRDWWFDNFTNDLVANIRNGTPYWWVWNTDIALATNTRAITLSSYATSQGYTASAVPVKVMQLMVSQQDKHLIAFGAVPYGSTSVADFDPLLIRWADQDNPGQWTPQVTNSAGDLRVSRGSRIVRALPTRQEILVWTDSHLYALQFLGTTDVFGLQEYADNISIASPRACATAANVTYWMGQDKFYAYTGRVETLPCSLRDHVFNNLNFSQTDQIICGTNEEWNEVWWFYPSLTSSWNDKYVVYNHLERIWYYGSLARSAWLDSPLKPNPIGANADSTTLVGYTYIHETGVDDDTSAMAAYIESNEFDIGDGDRVMLSTRLIPDLDFTDSTAATPSVDFEVRGRNFPGSAYQSDPTNSQPVTQSVVDQYTEQVFIRMRARQMALKVSSSALGVNWQLGAPRLDVRQDGRR